MIVALGKGKAAMVHILLLLNRDLVCREFLRCERMRKVVSCPQRSIAELLALYIAPLK